MAAKFPAWAKLSKAVDERTKRRDELFHNWTWDDVAKHFNASLPAGAPHLKASTVRKMGTEKASGLTGTRLGTFEEVLHLPHGWLSNGVDDEVPEPTDRHPSTGFQGIGNRGIGKSRISVYLGGTASMWHLTSQSPETLEVSLVPGQEDDTFVKIQDTSLHPHIVPMEVIGFSRHEAPEEGALHLLRNNDDPDVYSIRFYDADSDTYFEPRGVQAPLLGSEWAVVGVANFRYRKNGLRFPKINPPKSVL